jgi:hypothetical protein
MEGVPMFDFFAIFKKKKPETPAQINLRQGLEKWKDLKNTSATFIYDLLRDGNIEDIAAALVHSDKVTVGYIMKCIDDSGSAQFIRLKSDLKNLIIKYANISKEQSDKMKDHLMNNVIHPDYSKFTKDMIRK